MNIKFDISSAQRMIDDMDIFSENVQKSAVEILDILEFSNDWKDKNSVKFMEHNKLVCNDLVKIVESEETYKEAYTERINELMEQYT